MCFLFWKGDHVRKQKERGWVGKKHDLIIQWKQNSNVLCFDFPLQAYVIWSGIKNAQTAVVDSVGATYTGQLKPKSHSRGCCWCSTIIHSEVNPPEITRGLALPRTAQTHAALNHWPMLKKGFPGGASGKEPTCQRRRHKGHGTDPWVGKIPWGRAWQPTLVFSHGQREEPGRLWSMGSQRVGHDWSKLACKHKRKRKF